MGLVGGGGGIDTSFFWVENHESLGFFFDFEPKKVVRVLTPWGLYGEEWTSAYAIYAVFGHFCYVGRFGDPNDPVVPTLRGVSGDVVTGYAY